MRGKDGPPAKTGGAAKEGGKVVSVQLWARPSIKKAIVQAAAAAGESMSQFMLIRAMEAIGKKRGLAVDELIPQEDYDALVLRKMNKNSTRRVLAKGPKS